MKLYFEVIIMGLADLFQKKTNYFDKKITPQCSYCQHGKRTKDGNRILCANKGLMEETSSCNKFIYSPLKRVPVKQLNNEGFVADEEMYIEVADDDTTEQENAKKAEAKAEEPKKEAAPAQEAAPAEAAPAEEAPAEEASSEQ
ncbi:MAG: hypothetical protein IJN57_11470 [Oscillospiraceae bacterium]|nr:hypothetical protein [Oscillospiraceae bacterium]